MNSISKWLWLVGSLTVVNKFFWKKNLVDFFLKTHTSYLQLSSLSYAKILFEHGCFDKQTDPLVKVPFFLHVTQNMGWSYWNAYDGSIESSYKPCLIISSLHHLLALDNTFCGTSRTSKGSVELKTKLLSHGFSQKTNSFIHLFGEYVALQFCFEIYWPLVFEITVLHFNDLFVFIECISLFSCPSLINLTCQICFNLKSITTKVALILL